MQNKIKNILSYCFRRRLDGVNFTLVSSKSDLEETEEGALIRFQRDYIYEALIKLKKFFDFDLNKIEIINTKAVIDLNDSIGIYIELFFKEIDLFILFQFKGFFFISDTAFEEVRARVVEIGEEFQEMLRMTRVDVAQDILLSIPEVLPDPTIKNPNIHYHFNHKCRSNSTVKSGDTIYTGFEMSGGRFKLNVYDKKEELSRCKNEKKLEYYLKIFEQYPNEPITRVEIWLLQEACKKLNEFFYDFDISEDEFISHCLKSFNYKHKLRVKKIGSAEKDYRRWPIHKNWKDLFDPSDTPVMDKSAPNFLYTSRSKEVGRAMKRLMETIINTYPNQSHVELYKELFDVKFDEVLKEARKKIILREESKAKLQSRRREVVERFRKSRMDFSAEGEVGIHIKSPLERKPDENLNSYGEDL